MSKIIIGCDPDSDKSGFSFYVDGILERLDCLNLTSLYLELDSLKNQGFYIELHIENVAGTSAAFTAKQAKSLPAKLKIAQNIGQCKQVQLEIERIAEHFNVKVVRYPISSKWKKEKAQFEKLTGWKGRSNEDTRSAAYFGYIGTIRGKNANTNK